jgi:hypothetical protein
MEPAHQFYLRGTIYDLRLNLVHTKYHKREVVLIE